MATFWRDVRYSFRMLIKTPVFTGVIVLTLALGIGANTAIFSVVHAVLLSSPPYHQPDQLVKIWGALKKEGIPQNWISEPEWWELRDTNQAFSEVAAYSANGGFNLTSGSSEAERVTVGSATASLFPLLGVQPLFGSVFSSEEDQPGRNHVTVLGYALWKSKFGGDRGVVGKTIYLNNDAYTIVGVLPAGFEFGGDNSMWIPLGLDRNRPSDRGSHYLEVIGRRKPGTSFAQAAADLEQFAHRLASEYPNYYASSSGWEVFPVTLQDELVGQIRPTLIVLLGAVVFVLLIACANIANLLLARASAREKEAAIRFSMGASRARIVRQLLTESCVLALAGGGAGLLLGYWGLRVIQNSSPNAIPDSGVIGLNPTVFAFTFALSVLTGLVFGLAPALRAAATNLHDTLKEGGRGSTATGASRRLRNAIVVSEIGFALLLLVGAGLMVRSFEKLLDVDPGFRSARLLSMRISLPQSSYVDGPHINAFYRDALEKIRSLPQVEAAGGISNLPMGGVYSSGSVFLEDSNSSMLQRRAGLPYPYLEIDQRPTTDGYFETMNILLVSGRLFRATDNADAPLVAIVDTDFANHVWPGRNPIGMRISINSVPNSNPPQRIWRTVVGVVGHVHNYSLEKLGREQAYYPQQQVTFARSMFLVVRASSDPKSLTNAIREQVHSIDKNLPVYLVRSMEDLVSASLERQRLSLFLLGVFAILAVVLAVIGIYGVMAYSVTQRTQEIGIRTALGAQPQHVLSMVVGQGLGITGAGIVSGIVCALILTRLMESLLFGITAYDPTTFVVGTALLGSVAIIACLIPAFRATRVDPIIALRHE